MDQVEEIKSKLDIVQIIGDYVKLKKAGQNWKGRCPFHNEKTPSFMVNQDRQFYYCFGCNQGGDIFNFIQNIEGIDFPEALRLLAKKAGVVLTQFDKRAVSQKTRLLDLLNLTARYWQKVLVSQYGKKAFDYLIKRGLDNKTIENFKIGYAVDSWDNLMKFLLTRGYQETEIFQAGLTVRKERGSGYYDRFRDRVMFPIQDIHGNVVGFTGRTLKSDEQAKYVNTPESPTYHKSDILYGLDKAKSEIRKKDFVVVVEGNMDVIASHKIGVQNVVAVSGTALTFEQISLIKRFTANAAFCFDMDEAGQNAAKRSIDMALENELNIKIVQLISGKDPDECIKNNIEDWIKSIEQAQSVMQFYFNEIFSKYNVEDIEQKKQAAKLMLIQINKIKNPIEKDYWLKKLAQKIDVSLSILREVLPKPKIYGIKKQKNFESDHGKENLKEKSEYISELLISIMLNYPQNIQYAVEYLSPEILSEKLQDVYKKIIVCYTKSNINNPKDLSAVIYKDSTLEKSYLNSLFLLVDKEFSDFTEEEIQRETAALIKELDKIFYKKQIAKIERIIFEKEKIHNVEGMSELINELQELIHKKNQLE